jgi:hypothetical protein
MSVERITYGDLVTKIATLEKSCGVNTTLTDIPSVIRDYIQPTDGNVQYFSVDCNTSNKKLPVAVTVGSNFSQGPNKLPSDSPSGLIPFRPFARIAQQTYFERAHGKSRPGVAKRDFRIIKHARLSKGAHYSEPFSRVGYVLQVRS